MSLNETSQKIIAINAGSSSLKFQLFSMPDEVSLCQGLVERIGLADAIFTMKFNGQKVSKTISIANHQQAVDMLLTSLIEYRIVADLKEIQGVGHRVAHGGEYFPDSAIINDDTIEKITRLSDLAPLHNPVNLTGIYAFKQALPDAKAVAVFDTSFHQTMAKPDYIYPIPYEYYRKHGIRRYGFHGTSHKYVANHYAEIIGKPIADLNLITCHLGNGSSICAIKGGESVHTSMGFTPLAGVMMGTRCGDIDPSILPFLAEKESLTLSQLNEMMNSRSGFLGVSELSHDCRDIQQASKTDQQAKLALDMFVERVRAYVGQYLVKLGRVDAILFTGGIGENSTDIRESVCCSLEPLGICVDVNKNRSKSTIFSTQESSISLAVIETNEELMIAKDVMRVSL
ncbi:acetate kinase [Vibrio diazotrophicus]|jgi:propionate kinase|uniref:Acetate kinase n=1 Tax=Vibrio diazotrophicus TaxID=685 RepID=A0A2J8GMK0_VIBDI|nr:acetate kinase [Vibrio diazotrophicus]PNH87257.1 acetate kinase [Vibrio diazotrophicus]RAS60539.1 acetate kinase [Vibrio diazotrophicus]